jgi:hypothetical protein
MTITSSALLDSTLLSTSAVAFRANNRLLKSEFGNLAPVNVFKGDFMNVVDGAGLRRTTLLHTSTKHPSKTTTSKCASPAKEL